MRGQLHKELRAQALRGHYETLRERGVIPDSVRKRVAFLCATQPLELDLSTYAGVHAPWFGVCREHGRFDAPRASLLLKRKYSCPACAALVKSSTGLDRQLKHFAQYRLGLKTRLVRSPFAEEGAGWLYRIQDAKTGLCYYGITQKSVEERFQGHQDNARKPGGRPLHCAMQERPDDFSVQAVAFYKDAASLAQAEVEHIERDNTRWPRGYNLTAGGEVFSKRSLKLFCQLLSQPLTTRERELVLNYQAQLVHIGISMATWRLRLERGMSIEDSLTVPAETAPAPTTVHGVAYSSVAHACRALGVPDMVVRAAMRATGHDAADLCEAFHALAQQKNALVELPGRAPQSLDSVLKAFRLGERAVVAKMLSPAENGGPPVRLSPLDAVRELALTSGVLVRGTLHGTLRKACHAHHLIATQVYQRSEETGESLAQAFEQVLALKEANNPYREAHFKAEAASVQGKFVFRGQHYRSPRLAAHALGVSRTQFDLALRKAASTGELDQR